MPSRTGLSLTPVQRLALTPGMRHRLEVLRLPLPDLSDLLADAAAANPLLRFDPPAPFTPFASGSTVDHLAAPQSLATHLMTQIGVMRLDADTRHAAEVVIWSLNEDGLLDAPAAEIAHDTGLDPALFDRALDAVQACDPIGIGARDLSDCLGLQLRARGHGPDAVALALPLLDRLARNDRTALAGHGPAMRAALRAIATDIPRLDPRPGQRFIPDPVVSLPDLLLRLDGGRWHLDLAYRLSEAVHLDQAALDLAREDPDATAFLQPHRDKAQALIRAVSDRESTLLRAARALVTRQIGWFTDGPAALCALTRQELADDLGLHPATLGRALAGKTLAHPRGVIPLSALFSTRLSGPDGAIRSAVQVQNRLRDLIAREPVDSPLSDAALAARLAEEDIDIARRTVAKYRGCLNIPPSHIRKRLRARKRVRGSAPSGGQSPSRRP